MNRSAYLTAAMIVALTACKQNVIVENNAATAPGTTANVAVNETGTNAVNTVTNTAAATKVDADFVTSSIKGDTAEIAIGQLASTKGSTKAVRDFGQMLVTDHGAHKQKLIDLANGAGIAVPTEPAEEGHANLLKLQKLSGTDFDKTFAQMLVDSHHKGIAKNEKQATSGDAQTAALAKATLPVLKKHLAMAEALLK
jgi:putative membrane protein